MSSVILTQTNFNQERQLLEYHVVNEDGNTVGFAQLRLVPSKAQDMPTGFESNIYYETEPTHRGKGYATQALSLLLTEAAKHGLGEVVAAVNNDNAASIKVIENNGGRLVSTGATSTGKNVLKFILRTSKSQR